MRVAVEFGSGRLLLAYSDDASVIIAFARFVDRNPRPTLCELFEWMLERDLSVRLVKQPLLQEVRTTT